MWIAVSLYMCLWPYSRLNWITISSQEKLRPLQNYITNSDFFPSMQVPASFPFICILFCTFALAMSLYLDARACGLTLAFAASGFVVRRILELFQRTSWFPKLLGKLQRKFVGSRKRIWSMDNSATRNV